MKEKKVKIIPEGLKGDGTYAKEEYGYVIGRRGKKWRNRNNRRKSNLRQQ